MKIINILKVLVINLVISLSAMFSIFVTVDLFLISSTKNELNYIIDQLRSELHKQDLNTINLDKYFDVNAYCIIYNIKGEIIYKKGESRVQDIYAKSYSQEFLQSISSENNYYEAKTIQNHKYLNALVHFDKVFYEPVILFIGKDIYQNNQATATIFAVFIFITAALSIVIFRFTKDTMTISAFDSLSRIKRQVNNLNKGQYERVDFNVINGYDYHGGIKREITELIRELNLTGEILENNIKELNEKENLREIITEHINQNCIGLDVCNRVIYINHAALKVFQGCDIVNKHINTLFDEKYKSIIDNNLRNKSSEIFEIEYQGSFYKIEMLFLSDIEISLQKRCPIRTLILMTNIDYIKEKIQAREEFLSASSHELKTPIAIIKGYVELLASLNDAQKEEKNEYIQILYTTIDRMRHLVNNMLDLYSTEKLDNTFVNDLEEIELSNVAEDIVKQNANRIHEKNLNVKIKGKLKLKMNTKQANLLLSNLLSNAIKYNKLNGLINVVFKDNENENVIIVEDSGIGIKESDREKIFDAYYKGSNNESNEEYLTSSGLGLNIVYKIVKKNGGSIDVENNVYNGTSFIIKFKK